MLVNSWSAVENKTIANCFRKAGFTAARQLSELADETEEVVDVEDMCHGQADHIKK
jgi:hypothetical protein